MLEMKIKTGRRTVVPGDLPSILGARRAYRELGDLIEVLIAQMDMLAGDCDMEADDFDLGVEDFAFDGEAPLRPIYGVDQSAGPINKNHATQAYDCAEGMAQDDRVNARIWQMRAAALGAFDPKRHSQLCEGYDA